MRQRGAFLAFASVAFAGSLSCLDDSGNAVDWWFIYKQNNAIGYAYFDANSPAVNGPLALVANRTLNDTTGALGSTMQLVIDAVGGSGGDAAILQWNDEPPAGATNATSAPLGSRLRGTLSPAAPIDSGTTGHTKGLVLVDASSGFWLIHSVPLFNPAGNGLPNFAWTTSITYGQSLLCVSVDSSEVETIAKQISYMDPDLFDSSVPSSLSSMYPTLAGLVAGNRNTGTSVSDFTTNGAGGTNPITVTHFAKTGSTGLDLYESVVQPHYQLGFLWETWRRSPVEPTWCTPTYDWDAINVNTLQFGSGVNGQAPIAFKYTQDHSKWGVAIGGDSIVCVGGMNRMTSQMTLGGGTACFVNDDLFAALNAMITGHDECAASAGNAAAASA